MNFTKRENIHMTSKEHLILESHKRRNLWKAAQSCAYQAPSDTVGPFTTASYRKCVLLHLHYIFNKALLHPQILAPMHLLLHLAFSVLHLPKSDLMQNVEHSLLYGCRVNVVFVACCASYFPVAQCLIGMVLVVDYQVARDSVVWDKILPPLSLIPLVPPLSVSLASKITPESFWKQPVVGREPCCNVLESAPVLHKVEYELSNNTFCGFWQ